MSLDSENNEKRHDKNAVVIGASITGLFVGRVLAGFYDRATILERDFSLVLDAFAPSSPNLPALIQLAGIIVQPVTQTLFRQHRP